MSNDPSLIDLVCAQRKQMQISVAVIITMGVFLFIPILLVEPSDQWYGILVIDIVLIVVSLIGFGAAFRYCTKREMEEIRE